MRAAHNSATLAAGLEFVFTVMRYRDGQPPNPEYPYAESMHQMLTLSMYMSIILGLGLLYLGIRGKVLWLKVWSSGLIGLSVAYLVGDAGGWF